MISLRKETSTATMAFRLVSSNINNMRCHTLKTHWMHIGIWNKWIYSSYSNANIRTDFYWWLNKAVQSTQNLIAFERKKVSNALSHTHTHTRPRGSWWNPIKCSIWRVQSKTFCCTHWKNGEGANSLLNFSTMSILWLLDFIHTCAVRYAMCVRAFDKCFTSICIAS